MSEQPGPETEKIGGGISARLAAVAALSLLAAVVWLGVSGRSEVPSATVPPIAQASVRPAETSAPPPQPSPGPTDTPAASPAGPPRRVDESFGSGGVVLSRPLAPLGEDAFAVTTWLDGRFYMNVLHEQEPGHLAAVMRLPLRSDMPTTTLQVIQLWTREDRPPLAEVADYELPLGSLPLQHAQPGTVLEVEREARPRKRRAPRLIREGYRLVVTADLRRDHFYLLFDMTVGEATSSEGGTERLVRITSRWNDYGRRLQGRGWHEAAAGLHEGSSPPLILLVAQPTTPRGTMIVGHSWLAGY